MSYIQSGVLGTDLCPFFMYKHKTTKKAIKLTSFKRHKSKSHYLLETGNTQIFLNNGTT